MFERISLMLGRLALAAKREDGQGATEYAIIIAFLIVGLSVTLGTLGTGIDAFFGEVANELGGLL